MGWSILENVRQIGARLPPTRHDPKVGGSVEGLPRMLAPMTNPLNDALVQRHRPALSARTAETHAAFLLPHLAPGMALLDLGCGPGSITIGLAAAVSPGTTCGLDLEPALKDGTAGIRVLRGDAYDLPYPDATFDAVFSCATLQHLERPAAALDEARRVARTGAVIAIADADRGDYLLAPSDPVLVRGFEIMGAMHGGTLNVGRQLRGLMSAAGLARVEVSARAVHHGTAEEVHGFADFNASWFTTPAIAETVVERGWSTSDELAEISSAWRLWGACDGAFFAGFWCEALGWVD